MISVVPFRADHLAMIAVQPAQAVDWPDCAERDRRAADFAAQTHCFSFVLRQAQDGPDEVVLASFGLIESHPQHLTGWAVMALLGPGALGFATRWCREYIAGLSVRRIDMTVRGGFVQGHRWAELLGCGREGVQRCFYPDGDDLHIWARIDGLPAQSEGTPV